MDEEPKSGEQNQILKTTGDVVTIGLILAAAGYLLWRTVSFPPSMLPGYPGDALFPRLIIALIFLCGVPLFIRRLVDMVRGEDLQAGNGGRTFDVDVRGFIIVAAIALAFPILLPIFGFEITTFVILMVLFTPRFEAMVKAEKFDVRVVKGALTKAALFSSVTMVVLYVIFVLLLRVHMPLLFFPKYVQF